MYSLLLAASPLDSISAGTTCYSKTSGWMNAGFTDVASQPEKTSQQVVPADIDISGFQVALTVAPGTGCSRTLTVRKNGVDTDLSLTINSSNTISSDSNHTVHFAAGDLISIKQTCVGAASATNYQYRLLCNSTSGESQPLMGSLSFTSINNTVTNYLMPGAGYLNFSSESQSQFLVNAPGTLSNLFIFLSTAPGGSASWAFTVRKNGVDTSLTGTISAAGTTISDTAHSVTVAVGDLISISMVPTSTPTVGSNTSFALKFTPDDTKTSVYGLVEWAGSPTSVGYITPVGQFGSWNVSDTNAAYFGPGPAKVTSLRTKVNVAPGGSATITTKLRRQLADTGVSSVISGSNTENNVVCSEVYQPGDPMTISCTPASTPAANTRMFVAWTLAFATDGDFIPLLLNQ